MAQSKLASLGAVVLANMLALAPVDVLAQSKPWTSVGSAGTVDEADLSLVSFNQGIATVAAGAAVGSTVDIRYNVVAVDGIFGGEGIALTARFRDAGVAERVILRLKRYSFATGTTTTILTLDSNVYPGTAAFQTRTVGTCTVDFDFFNNGYFVDAQLIRTGAGGLPQLGLQKIGITVC
jgi:hypothetical protein